MEVQAAFRASSSSSVRRILLKISGEALMGAEAYGLDPSTLQRIARDIKEVYSQGFELCLVVGGGNIFRGLKGMEQGFDRTSGDTMGMLATVINAIALQNTLQTLGIPTEVMSALAMPAVCEPYNHRRALHLMEKRHVVLFAAGSGNPYFTTDTAAALRAAEMKCDVLFKGTKVDGVYSSDPLQDPQAMFYPSLSYTQALGENLKVMDATALTLAQENKIPLVVFSIQEAGNLAKVIRGEGRYTYICNDI